MLLRFSVLRPLKRILNNEILNIYILREPKDGKFINIKSDFQKTNIEFIGDSYT